MFLLFRSCSPGTELGSATARISAGSHRPNLVSTKPCLRHRETVGDEIFFQPKSRSTGVYPRNSLRETRTFFPPQLPVPSDSSGLIKPGGVMRKLILAAILPLCVVLAGCATTPQIPYDRMTAGNIKTIGIVTPKFPNRASVVLATTVGQSFGLVGALVDAGLQEGRDSSFEKMTGAQNFVAQDAFMRRLTDTLQEQGYTISNVDTMRPNRDKFLDKYPMDPVDAYLDLVVITYGYIAAGVGNNTPYRPRFSLQVRLVRAGDSSVLMQDTVLYNPYTPGTAPDAVTISPNPAYEYQTFSELESSSEMAIEGLKDAVHQTAAAVANLLR
jgi:hypothetical protein